MNIEPYYRSAEGDVTVYHAPYEDVLAAGLVPVRDVKLIHDDPPYGVEEATRRKSAGRGMRQGLCGGRARTVRVNGKARGTLQARDFPEVVGDKSPFDPTLLLALDRPLVIWGGHLCAPALPRSTSYIVWDKRDGSTPDDNGDCELAWTNLGGVIREFRHLWRGTCRASETGAIHLAPTQKPVALSLFVFQRAKLKRGDLVFVPHGGSFPDLPAARSMGLRIIACDVERWCCDNGIARLQAITPARAAEPVGPLFKGLT